jgi:putative lipoic acid-binding regulatory protein
MSDEDKKVESEGNDKHKAEQTETPERTAIMEYPCEFVIKMMGKNDEAFIKTARAIIFDHFADQKDTIAFKDVPSKDGNYLAISAKLTAHSQEELDNCYQALTDEPLVLIAL